MGAGAEAAGSVAEVVAVATGGTVMMTVEAAAAAMEVAAVAAMEVAAVAAMTTVAVAVVTTRMAVEIAAMTI